MATTSATSSTGSITSLGSGSNLQLQDILDKLQASQEVQLTNIKTKQSEIQSQISAYGTLQSSVEALQTAAQTLADSSTYNSAKATVTGDGFTATANSSAVVGNYSIKVTSLATAETLTTSAFASRTAANGTGGTLTVTLADGTSANVDLSSDTSLNGIAKSINAQGKLGVKASIVSDGNGQSYLMLTSTTTGTKAAVSSMSVSNNASLASKLSYDVNGAATSVTRVGDAATDAVVSINGITVTSATNTVDSAIDGVTLNLTSTATKDTAGSLRISTDTTAQANAVQTFVTAYNTLQKLISSATAFDASTDTGSVFTGDATVRNISKQLSQALRVLNSSGDLTSLADLGITTDTDAKDGTLKLDSTKLTEALVNHPTDVQALLSGASGLGAAFTSATNVMTKSGGTFDSRTQGLQKTYDSLTKTYDSTSERIDADISTLRAKFVALDAFVAQMNNTSTYLTQQFAALTKSSS